MDEKEYYKLLIEQYKIMVGSTEKVTDQRQKANSFFLTIVSSLISVTFIIGKSLEFSITSLFIMLMFAILNLIIADFWKSIIISYGKLNKGKFALIFELEKKLKANLFEREWEILTNKDMINYKPNTETEMNVVRSFGMFIRVIMAIEYIYLLFSVYQKPYF